MTNRAKSNFTFGTIIATVLSILALCGYLWGSATKIQKLETCCETNGNDVQRIEDSMNRLESNIDASLIIIHSDIKELLKKTYGKK